MLKVITFHLLIIFISSPPVEGFHVALNTRQLVGFLHFFADETGSNEFDPKKAMLGIM